MGVSYVFSQMWEVGVVGVVLDTKTCPKGRIFCVFHVLKKTGGEGDAVC